MAAGLQNKMWYYVELFYHEQGREYTNYVNESYLDGLAHQVPGLNFAEWMAARSQQKTRPKEVTSDKQVGSTAYGIERGLPPQRLGTMSVCSTESSKPASLRRRSIRERLAIAERVT